MKIVDAGSLGENDREHKSDLGLNIGRPQKSPLWRDRIGSNEEVERVRQLADSAKLHLMEALNSRPKT